MVAWKPKPPPPPAKTAPIKHTIVAKEIPKPVEIVPPKPKIYNPVFVSPVAKPATARKNTQAPDMAEVAKVSPDPNSSFSMGSSAIPTLKKPREEVQTGGFGDPNGVRQWQDESQSEHHAAWKFRLASRSGNRKRNRRSQRVRRASLPAPALATASPLEVRRSKSRSRAARSIRGRTCDGGPRSETDRGRFELKPVEILFKPKPAYTDEARSKKIEGEVLLQVVFSASGEVRVERVVQGLGYGLDESAESAARQIRFRPAQQEGQPVDSNAIVHITFEMAY